MRRVPSILLILLFLLGPVAALLAADDESRLPGCCRRHGAHHCTMDAQAAASLMVSSTEPGIAAPSQCPLFPRAAVQSTGPIQALAAATTYHSIPWSQTPARASNQIQIRLAFVQAQTVRGPPNTFLR